MTDQISPVTESVEGLRRDIAAIIADGVGGDISSDTIATDIMLYLDLRSALAKPGLAQRPADELAELIAAKAAEPAFVEFAKRMPALNEVSFLPFFKVGPTAVTHWRVALMSGREIGLSDEELKSAVSLSSTDHNFPAGATGVGLGGVTQREQSPSTDSSPEREAGK